MSPLDETAIFLEVRLRWSDLDAKLLAIAIHAARAISAEHRAEAAAIIHEAALTV